MIIYDGPSQLTGERVVAILTGYQRASNNRKTGAMLQTYILRADDTPFGAILSGTDRAVCGDCPLRRGPDGRTCYVNVAKAPLTIWRKFARDGYSRGDGAELARGRMVRLGAYGDPAAVPIDVWRTLLQHAHGWTGYTHQWRTCDTAYASLVMASCESADSVDHARTLGYRTFRVLRPGDTTTPTTNRRTITCPASAERGNLTTCERCGACNGTGNGRAFDVAIAQHK